MPDPEQQNANEQAAQTPAPEGGIDADLVLELNFVPSWARKPPDAARFSSSTGDDPRRDRRDRGPRGRDARFAGGGHPGQNRPRDGRGRRPDRRDRPRGPRQEYEHETRDQRPRVERSEELGIYLRFIPSREQAASLIRQIRTSKQAYPLMDTASLFMGNLDFCHVVVESARKEKTGDAPSIYQCRTCRTLSLDRDVLISHIVTDHMADYFEKQEIATEPPAGKFDFIARCGFSGALIGPPNHHSYNAKVKEIHRERFSNMPIEAYRRAIQVVKDPDLIEKWKQESCKRTVFKPRNAPEGDKNEPVDQAQAETRMTALAPRMIATETRVVCPMSIATKVRDQRLLGALRTAWNREGRHPFSLMLAFRGACKGGHLHIFKAGRGQNFVTAIRPVPLDPEKTIESIGGVLKHLKEHPGCSRKDLVAALRPGAADNSPEVADILSPLRWLIERGHIIEFFNGALAVPIR